MTSPGAGQLTMEAPDTALLTAARSGDSVAFAHLVERYRGVVFGYAYARLQNREEAEDVTQDTFVRAYGALGRLRSLASWEAWMMRVLCNLCNDALRRRRVRKHEPLEGLEIAGGLSPEHHALSQAGADAVRDAVSSLPEKYRTPLLLHYQARLTYQEISLALGLPLSTVRGRLAGALLLLRRRVPEEWP